MGLSLMAGKKGSLDPVREIGHILNEYIPASVEFLRFEETHLDNKERG